MLLLYVTFMDVRGKSSNWCEASLSYVRTALSVTDHSLPPVRVHRMSCRSVYVTLGYRWLISMNIWKLTYSPPRFETTAHFDIYDFFAPHINVLTYLLTYLLIGTYRYALWVRHSANKLYRFDEQSRLETRQHAHREQIKSQNPRSGKTAVSINQSMKAT